MHNTLRTFDGNLSGVALLGKGATALLTRVSDAALRAVMTDPAELDRLRRIGVRSMIVAPLEAGGRMLGTMSVLSISRVYGGNDVALVTEYARRVGLAADNAIHFEAARLASKAKSDFLAVMSHELRTPLTTVMGYADLLLAEVTGVLSAQSRQYVDRIRGAAWHLLTLIEQILIYSRVEIGREQVHIERVPLDFVLRDAAALIEPVAGERGLTFVLQPPAELAYLDTDITKLRQILLNLLSNAVKFTDKGEVELDTKVNARTVSIIVRDTGVGMEAENLERIFESFWQVDQTATRKAGGTGLGLSVARKLARLLGGDITVTSKPGAGSEFVLTLARSA
jgi:signal transduction histidine kinase